MAVRIPRSEVAQAGGTVRRLTRVAGGEATAQGAAALARGIGAAGEAASEIGFRLQEQRQDTALLAADTEAKKRTLQLEDALRTDEGWQTIPERGTTETRKIYEELGKGLKGRAATVWSARRTQAEADAEIRFGRLYRERGVEATRREVLALADAARPIWTNPTARIEDREDAWINVQVGVRQAVNRGFLSEDEGAEVLSRFRGERDAADNSFQLQQAQNELYAEPQRFRESVEQGRYGALRPDQIENLQGAADRREETIRREAEAEGRRRQTEAKTELRALVSEHRAAAAAGVEITEPLDINVISQVLGEATALTYAASVGQASTVAQMRVAPASSLIEMTKPQPQAGDARTTLAQTIASEAATKVLAERREDPIGAAIRARLLPAADDLAPMFAEGRVPSTFSEVAKRRVAFFEAAGEEFGATQLELFTRQEAEALQGAYTRATPNARLQLLRELATNSGGGPKALRAVARALNSPAASYALAVMNKGRDGAAAAAAVIEGERLLNPPADETGKKPPGYDLPPGLDAEWANYTGTAYTQSRTRDLAETAKANFRAIYASLARGKPGVLDADAAEEAARLAAGPVLRYGGRELLLPLGADPDEFRPLLKTAIRDTLAANGLSGGVGDYEVENYGGRRFYLVRGGAPVRVNRQPVLVDVPPAPARPARTENARPAFPRG